jgi:hypothetical protein
MKKTILFAGFFIPAVFLISKFQDKNLQESMKRGKEVYILIAKIAIWKMDREWKG